MVHRLKVLGDTAAPEVMVDMEALLMVQHMVYGMVGTMLEWLNGTEVL